MSTVENVLQGAAEAGTHAPSILDTRPWRWRLDRHALELWADRDRQVPALDPEGRLLTIACGAALHHALVTLAAEGHEASVDRHPDPARPDLLARVTLRREVAPSHPAIRAVRAIRDRRPDPQSFLDTPASDAAVECFRQIAEAYGVRMDEVTGHQLLGFRLAAERAHEAAALGGGTRYFVLSTETDDTTAWLATGEAIGAVLLEATSDGLGVSPMTEIVEVPDSRDALRRLIGEPREPQAVLRIGIPAGTPRAAQLVIAINPTERSQR